MNRARSAGLYAARTGLAAGRAAGRAGLAAGRAAGRAGWAAGQMAVNAYRALQQSQENREIARIRRLLTTGGSAMRGLPPINYTVRRSH
jgi:hypothetical protein